MRMLTSELTGTVLHAHLPLTDRWHRKERRGDESGGCYALDGEVGDDLGALSDGDHRTRADQLVALCVSSQPASFSI